MRLRHVAAVTAVAAKVTLRSLRTSVDVGGTITLAGTATPARKRGKKVPVTLSVQRRYGAGAWRTMRTVRTAPSGRYVVELRQAARIQGRTFPDSITFVGSSGELAWKSGGLCTTFEAWTGFLDSERAGLPATAMQEGGFQTREAEGIPFKTPVGPAVRVSVDPAAALQRDVPARALGGRPQPLTRAR